MLLSYLISRRSNAAAEIYDVPDPRNNPDDESQRYAAIATNENTRQNYHNDIRKYGAITCFFIVLHNDCNKTYSVLVVLNDFQMIVL